LLPNTFSGPKCLKIDGGWVFTPDQELLRLPSQISGETGKIEKDKKRGEIPFKFLETL